MTIAENLARVRQRITDACHAVERDPAEVSLLPVSKTWSAEHVREIAGLGIAMVGENRVQEAQQKAAQLADVEIAWSMIGHLQTNKAKDVIMFADEVQSVDSLRLATELNRRLEQADGLRGTGRSLRVYLQVNTSGEDTKSGVLPEDALALARQISQFPLLEPVGLMTIAALSSEPATVTGNFRRLRELRDAISEDAQAGRRPGSWRELSMGMSNDLELAIAEGATVIRVGRAVFGERPPAGEPS